MLRKSAPLFALATKEQPVSLSQLDEGPAHTLVHHLYAGVFERKLRYTAVGKFEHSTCVYCAAIQYQLPSLAELSKDEIVQAGEGLSIFDILQIARDRAFSVLPEDDVWYPQYLENSIKKAMVKDPEPFREPDFITKVEGNSRLLQIVWKTVMSKYAAVSAPVGDVRPVESGAETPMAESMLTESEAPTQDSRLQLPSPTDSVINSPPTSRGADDVQEPTPFYLDSATSPRIEAKTGADFKTSTHVDVNSSDDFGLPAIEPTVASSKVLKTVAALPEEVKKFEHMRADSVVEADSVLPGNGFDQAKREVLNETPPAVNNGATDMSKKSNKKKGKKNKQASVSF